MMKIICGIVIIAFGCAVVYGVLIIKKMSTTPLHIIERVEIIHTHDSVLQGKTIVVASDFHMRPDFIEHNILGAWVDSVNLQNPDFIFLLGDFIDGRIERNQKLELLLVKELSRLKARNGVFAVLGNHDWYYGSMRIQKCLKESNIRVLKNESIFVDGIYLVGTGDRLFEDQQVEKSLKNVPIDATSVLFLSHHPSAFFELKRPLTHAFSGHTHGGQVLFPLINVPIIGESCVRKQPHGFYKSDFSSLYVTSGIGNSILNFRVNVPPEYVIFHFLP